MANGATGYDVVKMLDAGIQPVVDFVSDFECGSYADKGMRARVIRYENMHTTDDTVWLFFDFDEFIEHNRPLETRNFYDKEGKPTLTGREYGLLKNGVENLCVGLNYLNPEFVLTKGTELFFEFKALNTSEAYITWLEQQVRVLREQEFGP